MFFLLSIFSYIYNIHKNKYTCALDTSFVATLCLKLTYNMNILNLIISFIILFILKINIPKSEVHSIVLLFSYFKCLINNKYLLFFNILNIIGTFFYRHITKITLPWHICCVIIVLTGMHVNDKLIIY